MSRQEGDEEVTNKELLTWFMEASRDDVFHNFETMEGAVGDRDKGYVFVPGSLPPEKRPLLVAHADTVWDGKRDKADIKVEWDGNICTSYKRDRGIGADDRAGVTMLWLMRHSGASLLLTDDEEIGCVGARKAAAEITEQLKPHLFAVQMDRRGDMQAVFYSAASKEFEKWLVETLAAREPGWRHRYGSCSDISVLGPAIGVNSVNLACGFLYEHQTGEMLFQDAWQRSVDATQHLIELAEAGKVPEMEGPRKPYVYSGGSGYRGRGSSKRGSTQVFRDGKWKDWKPWKDEGLTEAEYWTQVAAEQNWEPGWLQMMLDDIEDREARTLRQVVENNSGILDIRPRLDAKGNHKPSCVCNDCWDRKKSAKRAKAAVAVAAFQNQQENQQKNGNGNGKAKRQIITINPKDALLPFEWDKLSREERMAACKEAEMLGSDLILKGSAEPDDPAHEAYYINVIEPASKAGLISVDNLSYWENMLVFSQDGTDPRVIALRRGMEWATGLEPKTD